MIKTVDSSISRVQFLAGPRQCEFFSLQGASSRATPTAPCVCRTSRCSVTASQTVSTRRTRRTAPPTTPSRRRPTPPPPPLRPPTTTQVSPVLTCTSNHTVVETGARKKNVFEKLRPTLPLFVHLARLRLSAAVCVFGKRFKVADILSTSVQWPLAP